MYGGASLLHDITFCRGLDEELETDILLRFGRINGSLSHKLSAFNHILKVSDLTDFEQGTWKQDLIQQHFNSY